MIDADEAKAISNEMMQGMHGNVWRRLEQGGDLEAILKELDLGIIFGVLYNIGHPDARQVKIDLLPIMHERIEFPEESFKGLSMRIIWDREGDPIIAYCLGFERKDDPAIGDEFIEALETLCQEVMIEHGIPDDLIWEAMNRRPNSRLDRSLGAHMQAKIDEEVAAFREQISTELDSIFGEGGG